MCHIIWVRPLHRALLFEMELQPQPVVVVADWPVLATFHPVYTVQYQYQHNGKYLMCQNYGVQQKDRDADYYSQVAR